MTDPVDPPDPDLDDLTRGELHELDGPAGLVADVLDEWLYTTHGITPSGTHGVGLFLDLLAGADPVGYRVTPIAPGRPLSELLPSPSE